MWGCGLKHRCQTGLYSPQGKSLLNFLQKIGMELVQRFKIREYETLQGFRHRVLFADGALKPLWKRGTSQRWLCRETTGDSQGQGRGTCGEGSRRPRTFPWATEQFRAVKGRGPLPCSFLPAPRGKVPMSIRLFSQMVPRGLFKPELISSVRNYLKQGLIQASSVGVVSSGW